MTAVVRDLWAWLGQHRSDVAVLAGLSLIGLTIGRRWPDFLPAYGGVVVILIGIAWERQRAEAERKQRDV